MVHSVWDIAFSVVGTPPRVMMISAGREAVIPGHQGLNRRELQQVVEVSPGILRLRSSFQKQSSAGHSQW